MSKTQNPTADAESTLYQKITYPAFFEKVASVSGISPTSNEDADELLKLAHVVGMATSISVERHLKAEDRQIASAVKAASDSAMTVAGIHQKASEPRPLDFMNDAAVVNAAQTIYQDQVKKAGLTDLLAPSAPVAKTEEEEEEDKKK